MDTFTKAYATLVTSDSYVDAALVLLNSIKLTNPDPTIEFICLVVESLVSSTNKYALSRNFDSVIPVNLHTSTNPLLLSDLSRPDLASTYTKIELWNKETLGEYDAICYLDADVIVLQNLDSIFDSYIRSDQLEDNGYDKKSALISAAPDMGWPDWFNSGVMLLSPNQEVYKDLFNLILQENDTNDSEQKQPMISFDGADQGLLNHYFDNWSSDSSKRLSFTFNVTGSAFYSYIPAIRANYGKIRAVHFAGQKKPWQYMRFGDGSVMHLESNAQLWKDSVDKWWNIYNQFVDTKNESVSFEMTKIGDQKIIKQFTDEVKDYSFKDNSFILQNSVQNYKNKIYKNMTRSENIEYSPQTTINNSHTSSQYVSTTFQHTSNNTNYKETKSETQLKSLIKTKKQTTQKPSSSIFSTPTTTENHLSLSPRNNGNSENNLCQHKSVKFGSEITEYSADGSRKFSLNSYKCKVSPNVSDIDTEYHTQIDEINQFKSLWNIKEPENKNLQTKTIYDDTLSDKNFNAFGKPKKGTKKKSISFKLERESNSENENVDEPQELLDTLKTIYTQEDIKILEKELEKLFDNWHSTITRTLMFESNSKKSNKEKPQSKKFNILLKNSEMKNLGLKTDIKVQVEQPNNKNNVLNFKFHTQLELNHNNSTTNSDPKKQNRIDSNPHPQNIEYDNQSNKHFNSDSIPSANNQNEILDTNESKLKDRKFDGIPMNLDYSFPSIQDMW
ncbi:hypothetical protein BB558_002744 [Smittium angustum]|nr:hypothetical protein BB558_002744 [Smittium angustum]